MRLLVNVGFLLSLGLFIVIQIYWVRFVYWLRNKNTRFANAIIFLLAILTIFLGSYMFCKVVGTQWKIK